MSADPPENWDPRLDFQINLSDIANNCPPYWKYTYYRRKMWELIDIKIIVCRGPPLCYF